MENNKTVIEKGEYLGKPIVSIFPVIDGQVVRKPIISFGKKKAEAILNHVEEIKNFLNEGKNGDK